MEAIKPGMTLEALMTVFTIQGGLSTTSQETFVSHECLSFKVDVEFAAVGRPSQDADGSMTAIEDNRDVIVKMSHPYLQLPVLM